MRKRTLSLVVAAAIAAGSLVGCGSGSSGSGSTTAAPAGSSTDSAATTEAAGGAAPEGKDSLVIVTASDVLSMDPYRYDEGPTNQIMLHMYEAMVMQDKDMKFKPCLAESWDISEAVSYTHLDVYKRQELEMEKGKFPS